MWHCHFIQLPLHIFLFWFQKAFDLFWFCLIQTTSEVSLSNHRVPRLFCKFWRTHSTHSWHSAMICTRTAEINRSGAHVFERKDGLKGAKWRGDWSFQEISSCDHSLSNIWTAFDPDPVFSAVRRELDPAHALHGGFWKYSDPFTVLCCFIYDRFNFLFWQLILYAVTHSDKGKTHF